MTARALLVRPAANRVFGRDAARLLVTELAAVTAVRAAVESIAGVEYVTFDGDVDLSWAAALSSSYALFERVDGLLRPVELPAVHRYDDDLLTTQRYVGRTNEALTKLLVNLGYSAAGLVPGTSAPRVLDPLCGRGTTLNQALAYGAHALGVDLDAKDTKHYETFLLTWLKEKRLKHQVDGRTGRHRFRVEIGRKGAASADERQVVDVVTGDTTEAVTSFGRASVDVLVADLPYGVQHGATTGATGALARRPAELVESALPAWRSVLRPGGGCALAWNTRVLPRDDLVRRLEGAGYEVLPAGGDGGFEHRVDRSITRDVVVARRPER